MNSLAHIDLLDLDRWVAEKTRSTGLLSSVPRHRCGVIRLPTKDRDSGSSTRHADVVALGRCPQALSSDARYGGITGLGPGDELDEVLEGPSEVLDEGR